MPLPKPRPALVIRYSYLWEAEQLRGKEEGVKDRPCAIILTTKDHEGSEIVTVLPITHTPPSGLQAGLAVEIPHATKRRLGLDDSRSWIVLTEANRFTWPGPDLGVGATADASGVVYGILPETLFELVRTAFLAAIKTHRAKVVPRTE